MGEANMKKLVITRDENGEIISYEVEMIQQEVEAFTVDQASMQIDVPAYPKSTVVEDRATGELYEGFVENGVWVTEPLGESNG